MFATASRYPVEDITRAVDEVVSFTGKEPEKVILILQEVQKRLNYLPSEALRHICKVTEITPGQISGCINLLLSVQASACRKTHYKGLLRYCLSRKRCSADL